MKNCIWVPIFKPDKYSVLGPETKIILTFLLWEMHMCQCTKNVNTSLIPSVLEPFFKRGIFWLRRCLMRQKYTLFQRENVRYSLPQPEDFFNYQKQQLIVKLSLRPQIVNNSVSQKLYKILCCMMLLAGVLHLAETLESGASLMNTSSLFEIYRSVQLFL